MRKFLILLLVMAFITSILFMGIGCKEEAAPAEEAAEEAAPSEEEKELPEEEIKEDKAI